MDYANQFNNDEDWIKIIKELFEITEQKIYLEAEHTKLCSLIVENMEKNNESP